MLDGACRREIVRAWDGGYFELSTAVSLFAFVGPKLGTTPAARILIRLEETDMRTVGLIRSQGTRPWSGEKQMFRS